MNRLLFNLCGFYSFSLPIFPHLFLLCLMCLVWYTQKKSSNLSTSTHLTPWNTYFCFCVPPLSTVHHITVWLCGRVSSLLFPPPLPFLVKERMRLEREEATRQLEEETEVRYFSQGGVLMTFLPANGSQNTSVTSSFFLNAVILHFSMPLIKAVWSWSSLTHSCYCLNLQCFWNVISALI